MRRILIGVVLLTLAVAGRATAQTAAEPFKLGTFEIAGEERIGVVLQDKLIVDLEAANRALERNPA